MTTLNDVPMFSDVPHISAPTEQSESRPTHSDVYQIVSERIPEIAGGTVQVVRIVRAAGFSPKSVSSLGSWVQRRPPVCQPGERRGYPRLGGELTTFVEYSSDPMRYVAKAFHPVPVCRAA